MFEKKAAPEMASSDGDATFISEGLTFIGKTISKGHVRVAGKIEGDIQCGSLEIDEKAQIAGTAVADEVVVAGRLIGSIRGLRVTLKQGSHVEGDICCQSLMIEHGAHFEGETQHSDSPTSANKKSKAALPDATPASGSPSYEKKLPTALRVAE